jgi:hypothetical protein
MIAQAMKTRIEIPRPSIVSLPFLDTIIAFLRQKAVALGTQWNEKSCLIKMFRRGQGN